MTAITFQILTAPEVIAVSQDPLGIQGKKLSSLRSQQFSSPIFMKPCQQRGFGQQWKYVPDDQTIRSPEGYCLEQDENKINANLCKVGLMSQKWIVKSGRISPVQNNNLCVSQKEETGFGVIQTTLNSCTDKTPSLFTDNLRTKNNLCITTLDGGDLEVWGGPVNGTETSYAIILLNRNDKQVNTVTANWADIGIPPSQSCNVRDLWGRNDLGTFSGSFSADVPAHGVMMVKIVYL